MCVSLCVYLADSTYPIESFFTCTTKLGLLKVGPVSDQEHHLGPGRIVAYPAVFMRMKLLLSIKWMLKSGFNDIVKI